MDMLPVGDVATLAFNLGTAGAASWAGLEAYRARRKATGAGQQAAVASHHAERAASLAEPTGNGFAAKVTGALEEIKKMVQDSHLEHRDNLARVERKIDRHIGDHAAADVAGRKGS